MSWIRLLLVICLSAAPAAGAFAAATCPQRAVAALAPLQAVMANGRFVTYQPTSLRVVDGRSTHADAAGIERDLRTLRPWFDGLITYTSANGAEHIADIAARLGYRAVILGIWDIHSASELDNAVAAAHRQPQLVRALIMGNEVVFGKRGDWHDLLVAVRAARARLPALAPAYHADDHGMDLAERNRH
jgi:exo-beta-1,3-glucanase (GH17 family)